MYGISVKFFQQLLVIFHIIFRDSLSCTFFFNLRAARLPLRAGNTKFCAALGLLTGVTNAYILSCERLTGYAKNDREVAYHGALTPKEAASAEEFDSTTLGDFLDSTEQKFRA